MGQVSVRNPDNESEVVVIVAMLRAHDIPCFVRSENLGRVLPGVQVNDLNTRSIMVPEACVPDALELLRDFDTRPATNSEAPPSVFDKFRAICEGLLFGWFVPRQKRWRKPED
jgi:hypothetical protein